MIYLTSSMQSVLRRVAVTILLREDDLQCELIEKLMKRFVRPIITLGLGLVIALFSAAVTYSAPPSTQGDLSAAIFFLQPQPTSTPQAKDQSVIGSTDAIVVVGFLIAIIIVVPILLRKKSWMEPH